MKHQLNPRKQPTTATSQPSVLTQSGVSLPLFYYIVSHFYKAVKHFYCANCTKFWDKLCAIFLQIFLDKKCGVWYNQIIRRMLAIRRPNKKIVRISALLFIFKGGLDDFTSFTINQLDICKSAHGFC